GGAEGWGGQREAPVHGAAFRGKNKDNAPRRRQSAANRGDLRVVRQMAGRGPPWALAVRAIRDRAGQVELRQPGGMAERLIAPVLKTGVGLVPIVGSNPTPSAPTSDQSSLRSVNGLAVRQRGRRARQHIFLPRPVLPGPRRAGLLFLEDLRRRPVRAPRLDG